MSGRDCQFFLYNHISLNVFCYSSKVRANTILGRRDLESFFYKVFDQNEEE